MKKRNTLLKIWIGTTVLLIFAGAGLADKPKTDANATPKRVSADFKMERTLKVLSDKIVSSGKLVLGGPGLLRWEMTSPARSVLIVNKGTAWMHYPDLGVTKSFDLSADPVMRIMSEHLLSLAGNQLNSMGEFYHMEKDEKSGLIRLKPKDKAIKRVFLELRLKMKANGVVSFVEMVSKTGDLTKITFLNVKLNPPLDSSLFKAPQSK